jgi:hypothetical protein
LVPSLVEVYETVTEAVLCALGGHSAATCWDFKSLEELASIDAVPFETESAYVSTYLFQNTECGVVLLRLPLTYGTLGTAVHAGKAFSAFVSAVHKINRLLINYFKQCRVNRTYIRTCPVPITEVFINNPYHD